MMGLPFTARAETKRAELTTLEETQDLIVNFLFDVEIVDITLFSPSGDELTSDDPRVEVVTGDLWATYRVADAERGAWSVEYDLKSNRQIQYSIIEENNGLWIQYFKISKKDSGHMKVRFEADCESRVQEYDYEIYAIPVPNDGSTQLLASGRAVSEKNQNVKIPLSGISSGRYQLSLEISCVDGEAELYDSMRSDKFDFINPSEPESIEDYAVYINAGEGLCNVVWEDHARSHDLYNLVIYGDEDDPICDEVLEGDMGSFSITFPDGTGTLAISLSYQDGGIWSSPLEKKVDLANGEYLRLGMEEVTGSGQFVLEYSVKKERILSLSVNEETSDLRLSDTGFFSLELEQGNNAIYAEFESDNLIFYVVDTDLYFDIHPPEIVLYDELDGKTFHNANVDVIGRVSGGNSLIANGEEVGLDENSEFSIPFQLALGENVLSLRSVDVNGNSTARVLTLYRSSVMDMGGWKQYLPLAVAFLASILIILLSWLFLKKRTERLNSKNGREAGLVGWIVFCVLLIAGEAFCIYGFIMHFFGARSLDFLEMAERSTAEASKYLNVRNIFAVASVAGGVVLWFLLLITVLKILKRRHP